MLMLILVSSFSINFNFLYIREQWRGNQFPKRIPNKVIAPLPHSSKYIFFLLSFFLCIFLFVCSRKVRKSQLNSGPPLALIIYAEEALKMASTSFTIPMETVTQFTVTWSLSQAPHGLWWCHGPLEIEVFQNSTAFPSRQTRQWMRAPKTGISTDWVWPEWDHCRLTPPTGEQHAAIRPTASILETTSVEISRTLTSLIILGQASAREWNTSTSGDTWARIWRYLSGSFFMKACILTVGTLTVNLRW